MRCWNRVTQRWVAGSREPLLEWSGNKSQQEVTLKLETWVMRVSQSWIGRVKALNAEETADEKPWSGNTFVFIVSSMKRKLCEYKYLACLVHFCVPKVLSVTVEGWKECVGYSKCSVNICWINESAHNKIDCSLLWVPPVLHTQVIFGYFHMVWFLFTSLLLQVLENKGHAGSVFVFPLLTRYLVS